MTLSPIWRTRLFAIAGALLAVMLGAQLAEESLFWSVLCTGALAVLIVTRIQSLPVGTLLLGGALLGYIVGNRGFAQFSLIPNFPLLPAEFVLLVFGLTMTVQCAFHRELPLRRDALNFVLLIWMLIGSIRVMFDVRSYGFAALRDYALVYYGGFFFLAQYAGRNAVSRRFLYRCVLVACALLLVFRPLFSLFPDFFLYTLVVHDVPLIYYKDDLVGNFMAMGSLLFFVTYEQSKTRWALIASLALALLMLTTNSRSSMLGLAVGALWLGLGGRWRFIAALGAGSVLAAITILFVAHLRDEPWQQTPLNSVYERAVSFVDPHGLRAYQDEDTLAKGDNNVFRMVWWRAAIDECVETNPWFGLGFGYDLAGRFIREYLPEGGEDFTARSPHNVLITVFARMGGIGFISFAALLGVLAVRTWKVLRDPASDAISVALWPAGWVILACACFGVVLEGPMGAVVFWTVLGLANADSVEEEGPEIAGDATLSAPADLHLTEPVDEVAASP